MVVSSISSSLMFEGASVSESGIVGSYVLAGEIGRHCGGPAENGNDSVMAALQAYEQTFRPFMSQVQAGVSEEEGLWDKISGTAFGIALGNYLMGAASLVRLDILSRFATDPVKNWKLPTYQELLRD